MKIVDFNQMYGEEAIIKIGEKDYILKEPTLSQWGEYAHQLDILGETPEPLEQANFKIFMLNTLLPELEVDSLNLSMFEALSVACQMAFNGNIEELGKKIKPLSSLMIKKTGLNLSKR